MTSFLHSQLSQVFTLPPQLPFVKCSVQQSESAVLIHVYPAHSALRDKNTWLDKLLMSLQLFIFAVYHFEVHRCRPAENRISLSTFNLNYCLFSYLFRFLLLFLHYCFSLSQRELHKSFSVCVWAVLHFM